MGSTRQCARCERPRPIEDFHSPPGGRPHGYCRRCRAEYNREWYRRNRDRHLESVRANNERYVARNRAVADAAKDRPCTDCERRFPAVVMEFDHVRGTKRDAVSQLVKSGASVETIREEIGKCEVVCANCHRLRTAASWGRGE